MELVAVQVNFLVGRKSPRDDEFGTQDPIDGEYIGELVERMLSTDNFTVEVGEVQVIPVGELRVTTSGLDGELSPEVSRTVLRQELQAQIEQVLDQPERATFGEDLDD